MALAARLDQRDRRFFCLIGDGESREGQIWEALNFLVDYRLNSVFPIFNDNGHGQAGVVSRQQTPELTQRKLEAIGFEVARTQKAWGFTEVMGPDVHGEAIAEDDESAALAELESTAERLNAQSTGDLSRTLPVPKETRSLTKSSRKLVRGFEEACRRFGHEDVLKK